MKQKKRFQMKSKLLSLFLGCSLGFQVLVPLTTVHAVAPSDGAFPASSRPLEKAIIRNNANIDTNQDGYISIPEANAYTGVIREWRYSTDNYIYPDTELSTLDGIEHFINVKDLSIGDQYLSGNIPDAISHLTNLERLYIDGEGLKGSIPDSIGNLKNLNYLAIIFTNVSGDIPDSVFTLKKLETLSFASPNLTGDIASYIDRASQLPNLDYLALSSQSITGSLPDSIKNLKAIKSLHLNVNFTGTIPDSIGSLTTLIDLSISGNGLTGTIPDSIGNLTNMEYLTFLGNQLIGSIPDSIGNLTKLKELHISGTKLTKIPDSLANCSNLGWADLSSNQFVDVSPTIFDWINGNRSIHLGNQSLIEHISTVGTVGKDFSYKTLPIYEQYINYNTSNKAAPASMLIAPDGATQAITPSFLNGQMIIDSSLLKQAGSYTLQISLGASSYGGRFTHIFKVKNQDYNITYQNAGNWAKGYTAPTTYTVDDEVTLPNASNLDKPGYLFQGWYEDSQCSGTPVTTISKGTSGDKTYYAKWQQDFTRIEAKDVVETIDKNSTHKWQPSQHGAVLYDELNNAVPNADLWAIVNNKVYSLNDFENLSEGIYDVTFTNVNPLVKTNAFGQLTKGSVPKKVTTKAKVTILTNSAKPAPVTINYEDQDGKALKTPLVLTGKIGDTLETSAPTIAGYDLLSLSSKIKATVTDQAQSFTFVYKVVNNGKDGDNGKDGNNGKDGDNGKDGLNGKNGSLVSNNKFDTGGNSNLGNTLPTTYQSQGNQTSRNSLPKTGETQMEIKFSLSVLFALAGLAVWLNSKSNQRVFKHDA